MNGLETARGARTPFIAAKRARPATRTGGADFATRKGCTLLRMAVWGMVVGYSFWAYMVSSTVGRLVRLKQEAELESDTHFLKVSLIAIEECPHCKSKIKELGRALK